MKVLSIALSFASALTDSIVASVQHLWDGNTSNWESETAEWQDITG